MTDGQLVKVARQLQRLHDRADEILSKLGDAGHDSAATDLRVQCFGAAWPEHVIRRFLGEPDDWECADVGIRRRPKRVVVSGHHRVHDQRLHARRKK